MEPKRSNFDENIEKGIAFWRTYPVSTQPEVLPSASVDTRYSKVVALRWSATALAGATMLAVLVWPTNSHAGSLEKSIAALDATPFYKQHMINLDAKGQINGEYTAWRRGEETHLIWSKMPDISGAILQNDQEYWWLHREFTIYQRKDGYAIRYQQKGKSRGIVGPIDVKQLIAQDGKGGVKKFDGENWHGRTVIRYELSTGPWKDGQGILRDSATTTMIVDPDTNLPLEMKFNNDGFGSVLCEFEYPPFDPMKLAVSLPANVPIYDLDDQRAELKSQVMTPIADTRVAGKTIALRGLVVDHEGIVDAWTTGGAPRPFPRPMIAGEYLKVDGFTGYVPDFGLYEKAATGTVTTKDIGTWMPPQPQPERFHGLALIKERQSFGLKTVFPSRITVRIPIWGMTGDSPIGWAVFKDVKPMVTGSTGTLTSPMNVDLFAEAPTKVT